MRYWLTVIIGVLLVACTTNELVPMAYRSWIEDEANGLKVRKEISDFKFTFFYKPLEYIAVVESPDMTREGLQQRVKELDGYQYYTLKIETQKYDELLKAGADSEREYYQHLEYFVSMMQDDLVLIDGNDTLPCVLYHFEQNYHLAPFNNILLAFEKKDQEALQAGDKTLLYDDFILGTGTVKMTIKGSAIDNVPKLKL